MVKKEKVDRRILAYEDYGEQVSKIGGKKRGGTLVREVSLLLVVQKLFFRFPPTCL